jgi:hypothetical protein
MALRTAVELALLAGLLITMALAVRRLQLVRRGGIDVALRVLPTGTTTDRRPWVRWQQRWHLGVGRYGGDHFRWYRVLSLRTGPDRTVHRDALTVVAQRDPEHAEIPILPTSAVIIRCTQPHSTVEFAMNSDALTGFLSWLEAAPPGRKVPWAS